MFKNVTVVTSFSEDGWDTYAKEMIWSIAEHWEPEIKVVAYYHDFDITTKDLPECRHIEYRNLNDLSELIEFRERFKEYDGTMGGKSQYTFRLDAIKFCHKVFAITDCAFNLCETVDKPGWLVWLDADTVAVRPLSRYNLLQSLPKGSDLVHLGRKNFTYSETSFIGLNLESQPPIDFLGDFLGAYLSGELLHYREWHDGFIFERLLTIYKAHGLKFHDWTGSLDIKSMTEGKQAFELFPLGDYVKHKKGKKKDKTYEVAPDVTGPARYKQLNKMVDTYKPNTIIETGTWNGGRAIEMAMSAFMHVDEVTYTGYDLFEDATEELDKEELNSKAHNSIEAVTARLDEFTEAMKSQGKTFNFTLIKGDTKETLKNTKADFAYIDGGHSEDTVNHDYEMLKECDVIVFDDYVTKDENGNDPGGEFYGVNKIIEKFEGRKKILPSKDRIVEGGVTHLAVIINNDNIPDIPENFDAIPIVIQPRDCMPKEDIQNNVKENTKLINKWIGRASPNDEVAVLISGGDSTDWDKVRSIIDMEGPLRTKVVCVKHSYPTLLKQKIQPWACVILDPRPIEGLSTHGVVRKDLFKDIDSQTIFMPASMTDPSIVKLIKEKTDNIIGWHAFTQSLQENQKDQLVNNAVKVNEELGIQEGATMITGGTCAAMRSIGIMHTLGFRKFHLFGYDCSMPEPPDEDKDQKMEDGKPKYLKVGVKDQEFWTTGELIAMAQDCEKLFSKEDVDMKINFHGENTLVAACWELSPVHQLKHYHQVLDL